jgi:hypothetical protein
MQLGLVLALALGIAPEAGVQPKAQPQAEQGARSAPDGRPTRDTDFRIPKVIGVAAVTEPVESMGVPLSLRAYRTAVPLEELVAHFLIRFRAEGWYVPPFDQQRQTTGNITITALDVRTLVAYTAIFQPLKDGGTTVIVGEGDLGHRKTSPDAGPVLPGATDVVTSRTEGSESIAYVTKATGVEIDDFYRSLTKGWGEKSPLQVKWVDRKDGRRDVLVIRVR